MRVFINTKVQIFRNKVQQTIAINTAEERTHEKLTFTSRLEEMHNHIKS